MIQLNPTVGVAPGTTTMTLGEPNMGTEAHEFVEHYGMRMLNGSGCSGLGDCPPDETWRYVQPPVVQTGFPSGMSAQPTHTPTYWDPYTDPPQLKGLGGAGSARWGLVLFAGLAAFAVVFGVRYLRRKK